MNEELEEIKIKRAKKKNANTLEDPANNQPLGPGQYDPSLDYTRKQAPSYNWAASKTVRETKDRKKDLPGPGNYNQQGKSIGMKMIRGILEQETALQEKKEADDSGNGVRQQLLSKDHKKNQTQKKEDYQMKKKFLQSRVQPGAYQNIYKQSDFNQQQK